MKSCSCICFSRPGYYRVPKERDDSAVIETINTVIEKHGTKEGKLYFRSVCQIGKLTLNARVSDHVQAS